MKPLTAYQFYLIYLRHHNFGYALHSKKMEQLARRFSVLLNGLAQGHSVKEISSKHKLNRRLIAIAIRTKLIK